jgi:hypothetical protein
MIIRVQHCVCTHACTWELHPILQCEPETVTETPDLYKPLTLRYTNNIEIQTFLAGPVKKLAYKWIPHVSEYTVHALAQCSLIWLIQHAAETVKHFKNNYVLPCWGMMKYGKWNYSSDSGSSVMMEHWTVKECVLYSLSFRQEPLQNSNEEFHKSLTNRSLFQTISVGG